MFNFSKSAMVVTVRYRYKHVVLVRFTLLQVASKAITRQGVTYFLLLCASYRPMSIFVQLIYL